MTRLSAALAFALATFAVANGRPAAVAPIPDQSGDTVFGITKVHQVAVTVSTAEWNVLQTSNARGGTGLGGTDTLQADGRLVHTGSGFRGYFPWVHAAIALGGSEFKDVGLRYKGNSSFASSSATAPLRANFKVKLDLFDTRGDWDGLETLNLHAGVIDTTLMREALAYAVFRGAHVPASRTAYAELTFNVPGVYQKASGGRFVLIENVNRQFLKNVLPPGTGLLLKPEGLRGGVQWYGDAWDSYISTWRPEREATVREQQRVIDFARLVSQTDVALFRSKISSFLDVDGFLRYVAVNAFLDNWDSYIGGGHNFYIYLDPKDDKFRFIPWDEDLSLGARFRGQGQFDMNMPLRGDQSLIYRLLDEPGVRAQYRDILKELATTAFSRKEIGQIIDALETVVGPQQGSGLRAFLDSRVVALEQTIAGWNARD